MSVGRTIALATERVVAPVEGMHRTIADRWFGALGGLGKPVRAVHDSISTLVYESIRMGGGAIGFGVDRRLAVETDTADSIQAYANGLWGDDLGRYAEQIEISMSVRDWQGREAGTGSELAVSFPAATSRLVVLVHGLVETERCWQGTEDVCGLAEKIRDFAELTAVPIRYNSGLRISDNGARLASLLESLCSEWPTPVESVALVGHSMGGLVIRSAIEAGRSAGHRWVGSVEDLVTLGAPHGGAPLERLANAVAWGLAFSPVTRPLANFLNTRSVGIKDLRYGAIGEADWQDIDPDALLRNTVGDYELAAGIRHHFVAGVVTVDTAHPLGLIVGDLMVPAASGTAAGRAQPDNIAIFGGRHHFNLLHEPAALDQVMCWLAPPD